MQDKVWNSCNCLVYRPLFVPLSSKTVLKNVETPHCGNIIELQIPPSCNIQWVHNNNNIKVFDIGIILSQNFFSQFPTLSGLEQ